MPELPEVEAIRVQLNRFLKGHKILGVVVNNQKVLTGNIEDVIGASFVDVRRIGKVISMDLDNDQSIVAHVKMTGQFLYTGKNLTDPRPLSKKVVGGIPGPHTHVIFELDGAKLFYNDIRRFGWIKILPTKDALTTGLAGKMGPEPFSTLTEEVFKSILAKTRRPIKVVLMDQTAIGGVGNIYANDALWLAKINPKTSASKILDSKLLYESIHSVLKEGMRHGGSSENSFVTPDGGEGGYQRHTLVYGKVGEDCQRCKNKIQKIMIAGRGTFFCPVCQKLDL